MLPLRRLTTREHANEVDVTQWMRWNKRELSKKWEAIVALSSCTAQRVVYLTGTQNTRAHIAKRHFVIRISTGGHIGGGVGWEILSTVWQETGFVGKLCQQVERQYWGLGTDGTPVSKNKSAGMHAKLPRGTLVCKRMRGSLVRCGGSRCWGSTWIRRVSWNLSQGLLWAKLTHCWTRKLKAFFKKQTRE